MIPLVMEVPWWGLLPFAALLICIAALPLIPATAEIWERNGFKLALALGLGVPVAIWMWAGGSPMSVVHALIEYGQFITLLLSLFVVSGGIYLSGDIQATPRNNSIILGLGAVMASFIGTTGAAMLLIRPLLKTNSERAFKVHSVVFFIFLVANCGGLLTPLGDPPLFLGMLRGVPFLWTFSLFVEWFFVNALLVIAYFGLDTVMYRREAPEAIHWDETNVIPLALKGKLNLVFLAMVIVAVAVIPSLDLHAIEEGHAHWYSFVPWRELVMLSAAGLSFFLGDKEARYQGNEFSWAPIIEVAALFIGIFLTMVPALKYLAQVAPKLPLNEVTFFVFTGGLSSVLDNAPTYATFFEMAKTLGETMPDAHLVAGVPEEYLVAISLGAVFCGAITYIGNGPNFMVKAVADDSGVAMPSFGGYVVWAFRHLVPTLAAMACLFIAHPWWVKALGVVIALTLIGRAVLTVRNAPVAQPDED